MMEKLFDDFMEEMKTVSDFDACQTPKSVTGGKAFNKLLQIAQKEKEMPTVLKLISSRLPEMDLFHACLGMYLCGYMIERIGVLDSGLAIADYYTYIVESACELLEAAAKKLDIALEDLKPEQLTTPLLEELFLSVPNGVRAFFGCDPATLAVMDVITRESNSRKLMREKRCFEQLETLKRFVPNVDYVTQVYQSCSALPLLVLSPKTERGFLAEVNDLSNCFHLLTFLEAELYQHGLTEAYQLKDYEFHEEIYQYATGEKMPVCGGKIKAHQQYYSYQAVGKQGGMKELLPYLIWGEMPPESIPDIEGTIVIIMDPDTMFAGRSWGTEFVFCCHEGLSPYFKMIRELSSEEYIQEMERIQTYIQKEEKLTLE